MASMALTRAGIAPYENGGAIITNAVMRTAASIVASSQAKSIGMYTALPAQKRRNSGEHFVGERDHLGDHPVASDKEGDADGDDLRHE